MKKLFVVLMSVFMLAGVADASLVTSYGWEDGQTILGSYNNITATNVDARARTGLRSLELVDGGGNTPQAYLGWVTGLTQGDSVTAGFWVYDTNGTGDYPKGRIWGHYTTDVNDINKYGGSAGGNNTYSDLGWTYLEHTWHFDSDGGTRNGLVIEARTYTALGDTIWIDDLTISTDSATATITVPGSPVPVPGALWLLGSSLLAFIGFRKKKK